MRFLRLALWMGEAGNCRNPMLHQRSMRYENHVGGSLSGMKQPHIGNPLKLLMKCLPLTKRRIARRPMEISGHPGVDNVIDVVPFRRAHQVSWTIKTG
jgi:hypothetical protein